MRNVWKALIGCSLGLALSGGVMAQPAPPSQEEIAKIEANIAAWAKKNGYTIVRDGQGRLVAKDKSGKVVRPPAEVVGLAEPSPEQVAEMEARLKEWAARNGYVTVRDEHGRLMVKDKNGKIVRPPVPTPPR